MRTRLQALNDFDHHRRSCMFNNPAKQCRAMFPVFNQPSLLMDDESEPKVFQYNTLPDRLTVYRAGVPIRVDVTQPHRVTTRRLSPAMRRVRGVGRIARSVSAEFPGKETNTTSHASTLVCCQVQALLNARCRMTCIISKKVQHQFHIHAEYHMQYSH